jgi:hypothetical protein
MGHAGHDRRVMNPWADLHPLHRIRMRLAYRTLVTAWILYILVSGAMAYYATYDDEQNDTLALTKWAAAMVWFGFSGLLYAYVSLWLIPAYQALADLRHEDTVRRVTASLQEVMSPLNEPDSDQQIADIVRRLGRRNCRRLLKDAKRGITTTDLEKIAASYGKTKETLAKLRDIENASEPLPAADGS